MSELFKVHSPTWRRAMWRCLMLCALVSVAACQPASPPDDTVGTDLTGIDHLADHLSVQQFSVDGHDGFQAGKGGRTVCCVDLPRHWRPGLTMRVSWNVTNWRDCWGDQYERVVPVDRYDEVGSLWVHFLADGSVRVVSANAGPRATDYPGPHDPIPLKFPWKNPEWEARCVAKQHAKETRS